MALRREFRWWVLTVVVVGVLLFISALALDRPNVVWEDGLAHCPHCRSEVAFYSQRCRLCREKFDWSVAPDSESPFSTWSLSALEADHLQDLKEALGREAVVERTARALDLPEEAAAAYVDHVGRGRCGWCGGTGRDLAAPEEAEEPCPVCLGRGQCIACGGNRRMRLGDEAAHRAYRAYRAAVADVSPHLPADRQRAEVRRLGEAFLLRHAGTAEAAEVYFWPEWPTGRTSAVRQARQRLDTVLSALEGG